MAQMRRQSLVKFDAPLCETIIETPKPQGKEVLVRIERCGLCHSDLHIQDGYADLGGDEKLCVKQRFLGVAIDGGFASHVLVPDAKYLLDYDPLPVDQAATLMCSGVTAYGALKRLVDRPRQRNLLLIGLGGVGMMGLSFAQAMFTQK